MHVLTRFLLVVIIAAAATSCHEAGEIKVLSLTFEGTSGLDDSAIRRVLATRQSGWLPWSTKHYFNRAEFEADLKCIVAYYADRGLPDARVTDVDVTFNEKKDGVRLRIAIDEGVPVMVESVRYEGFDVLSENGEDLLENLPLVAGLRRDREVVRQTRIQASRLFRDRGYPLAVVDASERPGVNSNSVIVTYQATAGPRMTFGKVRVSGVERLTEQESSSRGSS